MTGKIPFSILLTAFIFPLSASATEQLPAPLIQSQRLAAVAAGETPPLIEIIATPEQIRTTPHVIPLHKPTPPKITDSSPKALQTLDPLIAAQRQLGELTNIDPIMSFDGLSGADNAKIFGSPSSPADVNGDIGLQHYVQMVNNLFQVFDKQSGLALTPPSRLSGLFAAAGKTGACAKNDQGDPIVLYDHLADRWLLSQFNYNTDKFGSDKPPYHECVAISKTGDPTGQYYVYDYIMPNNKFPDYPKFGVWADGYYMTAAQYSGNTPSGNAILVFDRTQMLIGGAAAVNYHDLADKPRLSVLLPSDLDGPQPPPGTPNYVLGFQGDKNWLPTTRMRVFEVSADFSASATGSVKERSSLQVAAFNPKVCNNAVGTCIPQPGVNQKLDALSDRPMNRLQYRYFSDRCPIDNSTSACAGLTFNHTIQGESSGQAAVRWYILNYKPDTDLLSVAQQGSFAPDTNSRWMGSAALNKQGELALGFSISSKSVYPAIGFSGRLQTDPVNVLTLTGLLKQGNGAQSGGTERWGDYSMMAVDPVDDCTFWYTNQYYANNKDGRNWLWRTRIGSFKLSNDCT
ncbi:MAG: hypothetical protein EPN17_17675 [Methylobacter sp.]|nr:MAG: hypothetical protein EPN17_17675 [Methylobacter sp.]